MKKYLTLSIAAVALCACGEKPLVTDEFKCGDMDVYVTVYQNRIDAVVGNLSLNMPQTISASGARYEGTVGDRSMVLWNKGEDWIMIAGDDAAIECVKKMNNE